MTVKISTPSNDISDASISKFMLKSFLITELSIILKAVSFESESNELTFS